MTLAVIFLVLGLVLLVFSAEFLVKGAARLAAVVGISPLVIGLTVVAFGTSAPELAVSTMSAFKGQADLALGNIVGSNIFNILVILGLAALVTPLVVARQLIRLDVPVMIVVSLLVLLFGLDGNVGRAEGCVLFAGVVAYTVFLIRQSRRETKENAANAEFEDEYGLEKAATVPTWHNVLFVVGGVGGLVLGSKWLVDGAVMIALHFGVSELMIGLTIVSAGTSLPEVATSVVAAVRGERDIAVGNAVGSNIFNILSVLGISSIVAPAGINVPTAALYFDIPVMIIIAVACLPVFFNGYRIGRLNGLAFLLCYGAYLAYLILSASEHQALDGYRTVLFYYAAPLLGLVLVLSAWQGFFARREA